MKDNSKRCRQAAIQSKKAIENTIQSIDTKLRKTQYGLNYKDQDDEDVMFIKPSCVEDINVDIDSLLHSTSDSTLTPDHSSNSQTRSEENNDLTLDSTPQQYQLIETAVYIRSESNPTSTPISFFLDAATIFIT